MLGLALLLAFVVFQGAAQAATFNVDSTGDGSDTNLADGVCNDGTGKCTLRAAIEQAASGDTVSIPSGTYTLGSTFTIIINLTLSGAGSGDTIIQASTVNPVETPGAPGVANFRLFSIGTNNVTISGVTIRHGNPPSVGGGIATSAGAAGTLTVANSTISGNTVGAGVGGGIANTSTVNNNTVNFKNTIIGGNTASSGPDCSGFSTSLGHNLIGDDTGCGFTPATGDLVNVDPMLDPLGLRDNGGPTLTGTGSPAAWP